jgi:hypothetical protein
MELEELLTNQISTVNIKMNLVETKLEQTVSSFGAFGANL